MGMQTKSVDVRAIESPIEHCVSSCTDNDPLEYEEDSQHAWSVVDDARTLEYEEQFNLGPSIASP